MGPERFTFGDVIVDVARREVRRATEVQHLEPQAFDLLVALIARRDRVVPKTELLDEVWGDQFVSESALTTRIKEVRRAVGDDGTRQHVVKNSRGRGYRFVAELDPAARHDPRSAVRGRQAELARLADLLADSPLVTLTGPGGVGKTTLARAAAWAAGQQREDGTAIVRLAAVLRADEVVDAVRRAARVRDTSLDETDVLATIGDRDVVVVLDNCEHVVGEVARVARALIEDGARCTLLATSRERLGVPGEVVVQIDPLAHADAAALFEERARAVRPEFRLADEDPAVLADVLAAVDRLPLGVEMAAGRLGGMTLSDLAALLTERLDVLRSADRGADRHRDMDRLVEWSTELLDPDERTVLGDFSVFAGRVDAADIEAVIEAPCGPAMPIVADLAERSLISTALDERTGRYRMLSTVRAHAAHHRSAHAERRHAAYYGEVANRAARDLHTADEAATDRRIDAIAAELRAAHRWARVHDPALAAQMSTALDHYCHTRLWSEPIRWTRDLLPRLDDADPHTPGAWALVAADAAHQGEFAAAQALASRVVDRGDIGLVSALETLQDCALSEGRLDESDRQSANLLAFGREHDHADALMLGHLGIALAMSYRGDGDGAVAYLTTEPLPRDAPSHRGWLELGLGEALAESDPAGAVTHFERALRLAQTVSNHYLAGVAGIGASSARGRFGDPVAALPGFLPVFQAFRRNGDRSHTVTALRNLVCTLSAAGRHETAMRILGGLLADRRREPYGNERLRLDAARDAAIGAVGAAAVQEWLDAGAEGGHAGALHTAVTSLQALNDRPV